MKPFKLQYFSVVVALILFSCSLPGSRDESFTVMSWNVQNLFDAIDDGNEYSEFDPSGDQWNEYLYQRRLDRFGEVCRSAVDGSPDILIVQEIEKPEVLEDMVNGPLKGRGYHWRVAIPGYSIIRCGVLSRYPISEVSVVDCGSWGTRSLRPSLAMTVDIPGGPVRLLALHWKSPRNGREATESTRRKEAEIALTLALERTGLSTLPILMIGDLNTPGDGAVLPAALCPWEPGIDTSLGSIFTSPEIEGVGIRDDLPVFFDPEPDIQYGAPGTYWFREAWDRPDRALLSHHFVDGRGLEIVSCRAGGVTVMENQSGIPRRWCSETGEGYSDHLPLILEFTVLADD